MLIIIDHKIPEAAKKKLAQFGELLELETHGITYDAISGHPDIFFCKPPEGLIVAPNTPGRIIEKLRALQLSFQFGKNDVDIQYPGSAIYNAVVTNSFCIHNMQITDPVILTATESCVKIDVKQGYVRCNVLALKNDHFIVSDPGIFQALRDQNLDACLVNPSDVKLPGFRHGFFGGACGVHEDKVFIIGSLSCFGDGGKIRNYLEELDYELIELYDGPLFDGGSIMF